MKRIRVTNQWNIGHDNNGSVMLILADVAIPLSRDEVEKLKEALDQAVAAIANVSPIIIPGNGHQP